MTVSMKLTGVICPHCKQETDGLCADVFQGKNNIWLQIVNCMNEDCLKSFAIEGGQKFVGEVYKIEDYPDD